VTSQRMAPLFMVMLLILMLVGCGSAANELPPTAVPATDPPPTALLPTAVPSIVAPPTSTASAPAITLELPPTSPPASLIPRNLRPITSSNLNQLQPLGELSYAGVYKPAFSPDGRYLSLHLGGITGLDRYGTVVVDLLSGEELFASDDPFLNIAFSQDSSSIYILDGTDLLLIDLQTGQQSLLHSGAYTCSAISPDGRWLAVSDIDSVSQETTIHLIDLLTGSETDSFFIDAVVMDYAIWFTDDGGTLVAGYGFNNSSVAGYGIYTFWDVESGVRENILTGYANIDVNPGSTYVAATILDRGTISILDFTDLEVMRYFGLSGEQRVFGPDFTPDGRMVYIKYEGDLLFWDPATGNELGILDLAEYIKWYTFSNDMTLFGATDSSHHITLWGIRP